MGVIECIFVDDCGNDRSMTILEELLAAYSGPITFSVIYHDCNRGLSAARNTGIRAAHGDYVYFLDSDDTITPDCIERLAALAEKYPGVDLVQGSTESKIDFFDLKNTNLPEYSDCYKWIRRAFLQRYTVPVTAWNKLLNTKFLIENGLYFKEGIIHEDELYNFFLAKHTRRMAFCKVNTYIYRENPNGIVKSIDDERKCFAPIVTQMYEGMGGPYICYEILCLADMLRGYYGEDHVTEFLKSLDYPLSFLRLLFKTQYAMGRTKKFSLKGIVARCCYHSLIELVNLTYRKREKIESKPIA